MVRESLIKEVNIPELVKALRCCAGANTPGTKCPFYGEYWCGEKCLDERLKDAATSIEALEAKVKEAFNRGYNAGYVAGIGYCSFKRAEPPQEVQDNGCGWVD